MTVYLAHPSRHLPRTLLFNEADFFVLYVHVIFLPTSWSSTKPCWAWVLRDVIKKRVTVPRLSRGPAPENRTPPKALWEGESFGAFA